MIFSYNISATKEADLFDFNGQNGMNPLGNMIEDDTVNIEPSSSNICEGNSIMLTANGVTTYTWSPSTGLNATTGDSVIANPTTTTTYTIEGTFGAKTITRTLIVTINPNPVISANIPPSICSGENTILTVSGATTYVWSPSTGLSATTGDTVIANLTSPITYTIIGTSSFGCSDTIQATVTIIPSPGKPTFSQHGDTLISSSAHDNQWYHNGILLTDDTTQDLIITSGGGYWVVVTNEVNGCGTASDTLEGINQLPVTNNQLLIYPNPGSGFFTIKSSKTINELTVTNLLGQLVYESQPKQPQFAFELNNDGMYFVTVTSDNETVTRKVVVVK
jgi:hypothetical protein